MAERTQHRDHTVTSLSLCPVRQEGGAFSWAATTASRRAQAAPVKRYAVCTTPVYADTATNSGIQSLIARPTAEVQSRECTPTIATALGQSQDSLYFQRVTQCGFQILKQTQ